ncbi:hypothetical protein D3C78_1112710 [compost metagenome]
MPNSGHRVLMPPSGSTTPWYSSQPHIATQPPVAMTLAPHESVLLSTGTNSPSRSCSMKRPARVPASTAVRMNSASKRIAKWYQKAMVFSPGSTWWRMCAIPTARVGAPPARARMVVSPMSLAVWVSTSGVMAKPQLLTVAATAVTSVPTTAGGLFMAK